MYEYRLQNAFQDLQFGRTSDKRRSHSSKNGKRLGLRRNLVVICSLSRHSNFCALALQPNSVLVQIKFSKKPLGTGEKTLIVTSFLEGDKQACILFLFRKCRLLPMVISNNCSCFVRFRSSLLVISVSILIVFEQKKLEYSALTLIQHIIFPVCLKSRE